MSMLEQRIADALSANKIKSSDLALLIIDVVAAATAADAVAEQARERALDPNVIDPAARTAMQDAEHLSERLQAALPPLREWLTAVQAAESAAQWEREYRQVKAKRDEWAAQYTERYPKLISELVELLRFAEAVDKECSRINGAAPPGETRRLLGVELTARNLETFSTGNPSIAKAVQLPEWAQSDRMAWPPPLAPEPTDPATPQSGGR